MSAAERDSVDAASREALEALRGDFARLQAKVAFLESIVRKAGDIIIATDAEGLVTEWNEGAERVLGYARQEMLHRPAEEIYVDRALRRQLLERLAKEDPLSGVEVGVRTKAGKKLTLSVTLSSLRDAEGRPAGTVGVSKDVSRQKKIEKELRRLIRTDALTGLYNQAHFFERLEIEKERARRIGHSLSLVLFDLDGFKELNDARGHPFGDEALRQVAGLVFESIRKEVDSGYRYGGDEFCVLLPGADIARAAVFAERLRRRIEELDLGGMRASLGVSELDPLDASRQLLKEADEAMYAAKRAGGNRVQVWAPPPSGASLVSRAPFC